MPLFVAVRAQGFGIERGLAIHQKIVSMMAVVKGEREQPPAVRHTPHRIGCGVPVVEVASEEDTAGFRRMTEEIHESDGVPRWVMRRMTRWVCFEESREPILSANDWDVRERSAHKLIKNRSPVFPAKASAATELIARPVDA